jgi:hypothetical protein
MQQKTINTKVKIVVVLCVGVRAHMCMGLQQWLLIDGLGQKFGLQETFHLVAYVVGWFIFNFMTFFQYPNYIALVIG